MQRLLYLIFFLFAGSSLYSQNLTGTWEGTMGGEFIQINITQKPDGELCGYTHDYVLGSPRDHCVAYYKGGYDANNDAWVITGVSFIENSGTHSLMRIRLWKEDGDSRNTLRAAVAVRSGFTFQSRGREVVELKRVSTRPEQLPDLPPCFPEPPKPEEITVKPVPKPSPEKPVTIVPKKTVPKPSPEKPVVKTVPKKPVVKSPEKPVVKTVPKTVPKALPPVAKTVPPKVSRDTAFVPVKKKPVVVTPVKPADKQVEQKMATRKKNEFSHLVVDVKNIKLTVYDNGVVDGDTVSIFYNGNLLEGRKRISAQPLVINLELEDNVTRHEIILYAHNLGSIPPNTALIIVTAGDKRYELHSSASLEENAVLVFEYRPK